MKRLIDDKILKNEILPGQSEDGGTLYRTTIGTNMDPNNPTGMDGEELIVPSTIRTTNSDQIYFDNTIFTNDLYINNEIETNNVITQTLDVEKNATFNNASFTNIENIDKVEVCSNFNATNAAINTFKARTVNVRNALVTRTSGKFITTLGTMYAEHSKHAVFVACTSIPITAASTVSNLALTDSFNLLGIDTSLEHYQYSLYDDTDGTYFGYLALEPNGTDKWKVTVTITVANKTHTIKPFEAINIYDVYIG